MIRRWGSIAILAIVAGCSATPRPGALKPQADPGKVIAAEIAFNRLAQDRGQWRAFRETSTDDAIMFVPKPTNAHTWLKDRTEPTERLTWQPHQVWSSCDGSLAATKGAWQRSDGKVGYFTTIWQRQPKGEYKWVLDQGVDLGQPLTTPEMIDASVAECTGTGSPVSLPPPAPVGNSGGGYSRDGSFYYRYVVDPSGARVLTVSIRRGGEMSEVLRSEVQAGG